MKASIRDYGTADHTTHDLAIARAERDAWQSTCEELHRTIAGRDVEIEAHLGRCEAADQRARSFESALTAEREAGKGLVAQVEQLRGDLQWARSRVKCAGNVEDPCGWRGLGAAVLEWEDSGETPRCPNCDEGCVEIDHVAEAHPECVGNDVAELAAIRDLVAPGNPQGTVVDAVRARLDAVENAQAFGIRERDAAIARAEKAESDLAELTVTRDRLLAREHEDGRLHAQLRVELAELRARPVLTEDLLRGALDAHGYAGLTRKLFAHLGPVTLPLAELRARPVLTVEALDAAAESCGYGSAVIPGFAAQMFAAIGPATLPSPDRAEELCLRYHDSTSTIGIARGPAWREYSDEGRAGRVSAMHKELTALAKLSPAPAPTFDAAFLRRVDGQAAMFDMRMAPEEVMRANAAAIAAMHNAQDAFAALVEEVTQLRTQVCRLTDGTATESDHLCYHHNEHIANLAVIADLRERLNAAREELHDAMPDEEA